MLHWRPQWVSIWLVITFLLVSACDSLPTTLTSPASTAALTPSISTTSYPKATPTTSSHRTHYNGQVKAYIGSEASSFQALFRSQGDTSMKGSIIWTLSQTDWFTLNFDDSNNHVYDLDYYFYPASQAASHQEDNVSFDVARQTCSRFIPPDAKLISINHSKPDPSLTDGIQYIYRSAWLSNQLDASWFYFDEGVGIMNDKRNSPVDPGTFTLFYIGNGQTGYEMCFLTTGVNWPY